MAVTQVGVGVAGPAGPQGPQGDPGPAGPAGPGLKSFRATGVTDGAGNVTFNMAAASFAGVPVCSVTIGPSADTALVEPRITALSATSCTVNVRRAPGVTLLGLQILQIPQNAPGVTVQLIALEPGVQA